MERRRMRASRERGTGNREQGIETEGLRGEGVWLGPKFRSAPGSGVRKRFSRLRCLKRLAAVRRVALRPAGVSRMRRWDCQAHRRRSEWSLWKAGRSEPPAQRERANRTFDCLSAKAGLSIILPSPHREAVVSFTRDLGPRRSRERPAIRRAGVSKFDLHFGIPRSNE